MVEEVVNERMTKAAEASAQAPAWATTLFAKREDAPARDKGLAFGRTVRAIALAKREGGGIDGAVRNLVAWGDKDLADQLTETKALSASRPTLRRFFLFFF